MTDVNGSWIPRHQDTQTSRSISPLHGCVHSVTVVPSLTQLNSLAPFLSVYFACHASRTEFSWLMSPLQWLNRMDTIIKEKEQASSRPLTKISGADAAKSILSSPFLDISSVGFDEVEAKRLRVAHASQISVRPDDTGASKYKWVDDVDLIFPLVQASMLKRVVSSSPLIGRRWFSRQRPHRAALHPFVSIFPGWDT